MSAPVPNTTATTAGAPASLLRCREEVVGGPVLLGGVVGVFTG